jgi:hypothetical protein
VERVEIRNRYGGTVLQPAKTQSLKPTQEVQANLQTLYRVPILRRGAGTSTGTVLSAKRNKPSQKKGKSAVILPFGSCSEPCLLPTTHFPPHLNIFCFQRNERRNFRCPISHSAQATTKAQMSLVQDESADRWRHCPPPTRAI